jgi:hypothetical protein
MRMTNRAGSAVLFHLLLAGMVCVQDTPEVAASDEPAPAYDPTDRYEVRDIEGWRVLVNKSFVADEPELCSRTLTLLRFQLYQIPRVVPSAAVEKLRQIRIWVELAEPHHPCMAYHPDPKWLREHDMNPDKAGCVEIAGARNFLEWTREQPWMVLHELAHGYHHQFLGGYDNPEIAAAFRKATQDKRYESVLHWDGKTVRAYAANNPMEYFAEATEAFFGTNDFYPFVRAELEQHDPRFHQLVAKLWGVPSRKTEDEEASTTTGTDGVTPPVQNAHPTRRPSGGPTGPTSPTPRQTTRGNP